MKRKTTYLSLLFFLATIAAKAQFVNNGVSIIIQNNANITVNGDFSNLSGTIVNNGLIRLTGNWVNNDLAGCFTNSSIGLVDFSGGNQLISGNSETIFPSLSLSGSGIKKLTQNASVNKLLVLNDKEFAIEDKILKLLNTNSSDLIYTTGFLSTNNKGFVYRATNANQAYEFPLGTLKSGSLLYRPVQIVPKDNALNTFGVSFTPADATFDNFDRGSKRPDVSIVNPNYYHIINQLSGTSMANYNFYYNELAEGGNNELVKWSNFLLWEKAGSLPPSSYTGMNTQLDKSITYTSTTNPVNLPIALSTVSNIGPLTFFNSFSPDGDGKNDKWIVNNLDIFPDNDITILNRWGGEVFKSKSYSSSNAWDGSNLNNGTYFYILRVNIDNQSKVYKGFITLLKNQ